MWVNPLDLQTIFVDILAGSMDIFIFLSLIAIALMAAYFKMLNSTLLIMYAIFGIIMAQYFSGIYFLVILIGGLIIGYSLKKLIA